MTGHVVEADRMNLVVGRLQMKARGFGFVLPEGAGETDVYIPAVEMNGAMSGDKVMARIETGQTGGLRREGTVIRVLERAQQRVVGKFVRHPNHAFVSPLDKRYPQDVFIAGPDILPDAHDGDVVVAEITTYPTATRGPEGRLVEVLGHPDAPGIDVVAVIRKYGLPEEFPADVLAAAEAIAFELSPSDLADRRDLRAQTIVTIDGEDAKDLDDAVGVQQLANGNLELGVHIADVGWYVQEGGALDKEAYRRGTSVYLVDRVIPMLPQRLSNHICSLNPHMDRLTLSCVMEVNSSGEVVRHEIFPSVIRTAERMTYTNVRKILIDKDAHVVARYRPLVPMLAQMLTLMKTLNRRRMERGAVDFDFDEVKVLVDDLGRPIDIIPRQRSVAERIIEEFMLLANETVAEHFHQLDVPFIYRIHEDPAIEKMTEFANFVHNFGYRLQGLGTRVRPQVLQAVLNQAKGTREERVISTMMLRSMRQARYAPTCVGHFGLAADYYTHFTSPIRRYPDLVIHRILRESFAAGAKRSAATDNRPHGGAALPERRDRHLRSFVEEASIQSSERERVAQDAERECDQLKMVEYMREHIGEQFDGIVSGVTQFGLFVQLLNGVEGLIHISSLADDYYVFNDKQMALVGERTRRVFRLGDPVRVQTEAANKENLTIDFTLVTHHREGTMTVARGVETVVYDEDLADVDRENAIAKRDLAARAHPRTGFARHSGGRDGDRSRGGSGRVRADDSAGGSVDGGPGGRTSGGWSVADDIGSGASTGDRSRGGSSKVERAAGGRGPRISRRRNSTRARGRAAAAAADNAQAWADNADSAKPAKPGRGKRKHRLTAKEQRKRTARTGGKAPDSPTSSASPTASAIAPASRASAPPLVAAGASEKRRVLWPDSAVAGMAERKARRARRQEEAGKSSRTATARNVAKGVAKPAARVGAGPIKNAATSPAAKAHPRRRKRKGTAPNSAE